MSRTKEARLLFSPGIAAPPIPGIAAPPIPDIAAPPIPFIGAPQKAQNLAPSAFS
ncbi:hypothetical protein [Bifidobacterium pullorum]|uniref:hypothetical protein n=1 Tax=Bifidobacterium pullorum TaxID=78448 RepID=UPI001EF68EB3|nr:hypothetical protein [Bifidobacterium pullorum]